MTMTKGLLKYHLLVLLREPLNMFFGFGLPFLQLFIMSSGLLDADNPMIMDGAMPIFVVIAAMVLCFTDSALSHGYTRQIKFLRRLRMTPVKPLGYIACGIVSRIGVLFIFAATFIAVLAGFFNMSLDGRNWPLFTAVLVLCFVMFYVIGMFVANSTKNAKNSQSLVYVVFFGLLAVGGAMFPIESMPSIMQTAAQWLPPAMAIEVLRNAWMGMDIMAGHDFIMIIILTIVFGGLSVKFFKYE